MGWAQWAVEESATGGQLVLRWDYLPCLGRAWTFMSDLIIRRWTRNVPTLEFGRLDSIRKRVLPCCSLQTAVLDDLRRLGVRPKRSLGQNFLISESVLSDIVEVACIRAGDHVVEIGVSQPTVCCPTP